MSMELCCATCGYWSDEEPPCATGSRRPDGADTAIGICRRWAPTILSLAGIVGTYFPSTHRDRYCGEWIQGEPEGPGGGEEVDHNVVPIGRAA